MSSAGEHFSTSQRAHVVDVDAARLVAFVLPAGPLLRAPLITAGVIGAGLQI